MSDFAHGVASLLLGLAPEWLLKRAVRIVALAARGEKGAQMVAGRLHTTPRASEEGAE